jgi:signal transduction histidine kinase
MPEALPRRDEPGATILVVEDDLGLAELIREELGLRGWDCHHCATGLEAVAWLERRRPTLVLLDYSLPDMTGAELLRRVPVEHFLVTTGAGDERVAVAMMKQGALDYLVKDGMFLETLPGVVELALHHIGIERRLAETERSLRIAEEDLARARRMESLGLMAGGIAHDYNNLFQGLQGNLELARLRAGDGPLGAPLDRALKILEKAALLTHRMLEFSGKGFRGSEPLALNELVRACIACLAPTGDLRGLRFTGAPGLPEIAGDRKQLMQVITALVRNAREAVEATEAAAPGSGSVQVQTRLLRAGAEGNAGAWVSPAPAGAATVCLAVADNGPGMSPEILERAFDPFFSTRSPGRGLGLSAALGILKTHDAGLWVDSTPGQGTVFRIHFPPRTT